MQPLHVRDYALSTGGLQAHSRPCSISPWTGDRPNKVAMACSRSARCLRMSAACTRVESNCTLGLVGHWFLRQCQGVWQCPLWSLCGGGCYLCGRNLVAAMPSYEIGPTQNRSSYPGFPQPSSTLDASLRFRPLCVHVSLCNLTCPGSTWRTRKGQGREVV